MIINFIGYNDIQQQFDNIPVQHSMKYALITTIVKLLLPANIRCQQEQHNEVNLINRLNAFFGFDHKIFLLDSLTDYSQCIQLKESNYNNFTSQTVYVLDQIEQLNCQKVYHNMMDGVIRYLLQALLTIPQHLTRTNLM